jgi:hypothetical protein
MIIFWNLLVRNLAETAGAIITSASIVTPMADIEAIMTIATTPAKKWSLHHVSSSPLCFGSLLIKHYEKQPLVKEYGK